MQIVFAAEILVIRLAKTIQRSIMTSFGVVGIPDMQIVRKANRQQNHYTASGIVSNN